MSGIIIINQFFMFRRGKRRARQSRGGERKRGKRKEKKGIRKAFPPSNKKKGGRGQKNKEAENKTMAVLITFLKMVPL